MRALTIMVRRIALASFALFLTPYAPARAGDAPDYFKEIVGVRRRPG
jgi:hypothetical protein